MVAMPVEVLPMSVAGKLSLLARSAPLCLCGGDCKARRFFVQELERVVEESDWIEGDLSPDDE